MATQFVSLAGLHHRSSSTETFTGVRRARSRERAAGGFSPLRHVTCICEPQENGYDSYKVGVQASDRHDTKGDHNNTIMERNQPPRATNGTKKRLERKKRNEGIGRREVPRFLGLWFMSSAISYILRKARAFYNEFCCDNYDDLTCMQGENEQMLVNPYFAVPMIPPPAAATI